MIVFYCKKCGKVIFGCVDDVDCILDAKGEIRAMQRRGFKMDRIDTSKNKEPVEWCGCRL